MRNKSYHVLKIRQNNNIQEVFDPIRKNWVLLTEEEKVRQFFILYLISELHVPQTHISIERKIMVNGTEKRYDILVFKPNGDPWMVVECKAPHIPLTQKVLEQAGRYNKTIRADIICVTNGKNHRFFNIDFDTEEISEISF